MLIKKFFNVDESTITSDDIAELHKIVDEYPFFTCARVILTKYYYKKKNKNGFEDMMNHLKYEHPNREHIKYYVRKAVVLPESKTIASSKPKEIVPVKEKKVTADIEKKKKIIPIESSRNQWRSVQKPKSTKKVWTSSEVQSSLEKIRKNKKNVDNFLALAKETKKSVDDFFEKFGTDAPPKKTVKKITKKRAVGKSSKTNKMSKTVSNKSIKNKKTIKAVSKSANSSKKKSPAKTK